MYDLAFAMQLHTKYLDDYKNSKDFKSKDTISNSTLK